MSLYLFIDKVQMISIPCYMAANILTEEQEHNFCIDIFNVSTKDDVKTIWYRARMRCEQCNNREAAQRIKDCVIDRLREIEQGIDINQPGDN